MTQNVKRNTIGRLALGFFAAMLVLTLLNQKIDALRTPTVATVWPKAGQINGAEYSTVLPTETLRQENGETFVYIAEESTSWRYETTARRVRVTVLEQNESWTAVSGLSGDAPVVQYATTAAPCGCGRGQHETIPYGAENFASGRAAGPGDRFGMETNGIGRITAR